MINIGWKLCPPILLFRKKKNLWENCTGIKRLWICTLCRKEMKKKRNNLDIFRIIIWRIKNVISIFLYYYMCGKKNYEKLFVSLHHENFSEWSSIKLLNYSKVKFVWRARVIQILKKRIKILIKKSWKSDIWKRNF